MALQQVSAFPVSEGDLQTRINYLLEVLSELEQLFTLHEMETSNTTLDTSPGFVREWLYSVCFNWFRSHWHIVQEDSDGVGFIFFVCVFSLYELIY